MSAQRFIYKFDRDVLIPREEHSYRHAWQSICETMSHRERHSKFSGTDLARVIRPVFETFLGRAGLRVLEYHLEKLLQNDPYETLYADPHSFYLAVRSIFGQGADAIIQLMAKKMIEENILDLRDPDEFLKTLKDPQRGREKLSRMLRIS